MSREQIGGLGERRTVFVESAQFQSPLPKGDGFTDTYETIVAQAPTFDPNGPWTSSFPVRPEYVPECEVTPSPLKLCLDPTTKTYYMATPDQRQKIVFEPPPEEVQYITPMVKTVFSATGEVRTLDGSMGTGVTVPQFEAMAPMALPQGGFLNVILTNRHVVAREAVIPGDGPIPIKQIQIHQNVVFIPFMTGVPYEGRVVSVIPDDGIDMAMIFVITPQPLPVAPIAPSSSVMLGEPVYAIGSPLGMHGTTSFGVISYVKRILDPGAPWCIQSTAPICPGNSGGPLITQQGVVGINTFSINTQENTAQNMNFSYAADIGYMGLRQRLDNGIGLAGFVLIP